MAEQNQTPLDPQNLEAVKAFESGPDSHAFWHTSSHIMAQAVKRLFPEAKLG
ncbi:MAG TPA: hypothetical protein GX726_05395, partial [Clostridiales bacterium]|nr:hypothetical protein [Clostridiales bacterium]